MTPVEALASGKPVIALGRGGVLETVPEFGGVFYSSEESVPDALLEFEQLEAGFDPKELQQHAQHFSPAVFTRRMSTLLAEERAQPVHPRPRTASRISFPA